MAEATASVFFWGFLYYIKMNPFKKVFTPAEIDTMAKLYATANPGTIQASTVAAADPVAVGGAYTDIEWPDKDAGTSTITAYRDVASINQAHYPEKHFGS